MHQQIISRKSKENQIKKYVTGLLFTETKKNYSNIARSMNESHDSITRIADGSVQSIDLLKLTLERVIEEYILKDRMLLIFDDTMITKNFAHQIEGLEKGFDGSTGQPALGIRFITGMITDGVHSLPLCAELHSNKELSGDLYKSKPEKVIELLRSLTKRLKPQYLLMDAHYFSQEMIAFLRHVKLNFLIKIPKNRTVKIAGLIGLLKNIFKLSKNQKYATKKGSLHGQSVYFHAIKCDRSNRILYYIGNEKITARQAKKLYQKRWTIEKFYRTAKQSLGLSDCQATSSEKQLQHVLSAMLAYLIAEIYRTTSGFDVIEDAIRKLRQLKIPYAYFLINRFHRNYLGIA